MEGMREGRTGHSFSSKKWKIEAPENINASICILIWINYDFCATHTLKRHINAGSVILYAKPYTTHSVRSRKKKTKQKRGTVPPKHTS